MEQARMVAGHRVVDKYGNVITAFNSKSMATKFISEMTLRYGDKNISYKYSIESRGHGSNVYRKNGDKY